jgi:hypothetical protein
VTDRLKSIILGTPSGVSSPAPTQKMPASVATVDTTRRVISKPKKRKKASAATLFRDLP